MSGEGDCYEAAANYVLQHSGIISFMVPPGVTPRPGLILVHGEVTGQGPIEGVKFGHAWVEDGGLVIDPSNGKMTRMSKAEYYALGRIGGNVFNYTAEEARKNLVRYKHWGPWELKTSSGL